nr:uncharacterized protein LOC128688376 isoform X2 [Cherax quadricarinatus]
MYMQKTYNITQSLVCSTGDEKPFAPQLKHLLKQENKVPHDLGIVILLALSIGILQDLYKILRLRMRYMKWENFNFLLCTTTTFIFIIDITSCSKSTNMREPEVNSRPNDGLYPEKFAWWGVRKPRTGSGWWE